MIARIRNDRVNYNVQIVISLMEKMKQAIENYDKVKLSLFQEFQREPTSEEIAIELGVDLDFCRKIPNLYIFLDKITPKTIDIETVLIDDGTYNQTIRNSESSLIREEIYRLKLSKREIQFIELRYGLRDGVYLTYEEVGNIMEVTRERARQIDYKILEKLREPMRKYYEI